MPKVQKAIERVLRGQFSFSAAGAYSLRKRVRARALLEWPTQKLALETGKFAKVLDPTRFT